MGSIQSTHLKFLRNSTPFHSKSACNVIFNSLICACVANEILKRFGSIRVGDGGSPRNCWWGVTFGVLNRDPISAKTIPFFICLYALVVPLKTVLISDYLQLYGQNDVGFLTKNAQKALSLGWHLPIADIHVGEYPQGNVSIWCKFPKGFEILLGVKC